MKVRKFDKRVDEIEWNKFLSATKNSSFLFNRNFMDYHASRFIDYSLMVYNEEKLVALLPANVVGDTLISHQGLTYGGVILPIDIKLNQVILIVFSILKFVHSSGISFIQLKLIPSFFARYATDDIEYIMFLLNAQLFRRDSAIVIDYTERIPYTGNIRREGASAEKKGAYVKFDDEFPEFWNEVLTPNLLNRFGVKPVHTLEEIVLLKNRFPDNIIHINVYLNHKPAAGTTLFIDNKTVHCQYISATDSGRKEGCLNFLFKTVIDYYSKSYNYFDFGIVNENEGRQLNKGMLFWKEGLGGRTRKHDFYKITTSHFSMLEKYIDFPNKTQ